MSTTRREARAVAALNGIIFDQIYGDNSDGAEFDTDGDGFATQEDEFVSFTNTTAAPVDISGWEVWSDTSGAGAPDGSQDGLYHVFPPGTVIGPGKTLFVINEITGTVPGWAQEASEGGVESGAGGINTNFLTEGTDALDSESIALVNPTTGDFIVFNMASTPSDFAEFDGGGTGSNPAVAAFPGSNMLGEIDAASVEEDMDAGSSYKYDSGTDSYIYAPIFMSCFAAGTLVETPNGPRPVEQLCQGDLVLTKDNGPKPILLILSRKIGFHSAAYEVHRPVFLGPSSLGRGVPNLPLTLSPLHRLMVTLPDGKEALVPAKAFLHLPGIRRKNGVKRVSYFHLVLATHEILTANGAPAESFFAGNYGKSRLLPRARLALERMGLRAGAMRPARPLVGASAFARAMSRHAWPLFEPCITRGAALWENPKSQVDGQAELSRAICETRPLHVFPDRR